MLVSIPVMMMAAPIPPEVKKVVAFVFLQSASGQAVANGTGFFVGIADPANKDRSFGYFVTARHVVSQAGGGPLYKEVFLRLNKNDGKTSEFVKLPLSGSGPSKNVFTHSDPSVDIAVIPAVPDQKMFDFKLLDQSLLTTKDDYRTLNITGFDAPSMHTMYIDKPMQGHGLMQAIARVNRVFKDKPGGLVVDYLGLADELRQALQTYTESGGKGRPEIDQEEAVEALLGRYESCSGLFHGFSWAKWTTGTPAERVSLLPAAQEHILALPALGPEGSNDGKKRLLDEVAALSKAFALAMPHERAIAIREDVGFFQAVRAVLAKNDDGGGERKTKEDLDHAIRQIVSEAVASDQVIDIFEAAGLKKPDISILSDQFLSDVRNMPQKNLAIELLRKLLMGEIKTRAKHNVVQSRSFLEMLEQSIRRYTNRAIETAQVIDELIKLAKDVREADKRGEELGLTSDEKAFYDALETNDSAVKVMGEPSLVIIARELTDTVKKNTSIDWTMRENVQAHLRVLVKRILRKHG